MATAAVTPSVQIGEQIYRLMNEAAQETLAAAAGFILTQAKAQAPPGPTPDIDPNPSVTLQDSGAITQISPTEFVVHFDTEYAAFQHEQLDLKHKHGGKAKYLEDPLKQAAPGLALALGKHARKKLASIPFRVTSETGGVPVLPTAVGPEFLAHDPNAAEVLGLTAG
jgi:hypothetical protein